MRHVELVPGIGSSVIGFGCAPILGAVGWSEAERAISVALDVGINHFDLARSYGYGRAEGMVGRVLRGKRDQVVLATKFGIEASAAAYLLSPLKPIIRALRPRRSPVSPRENPPPSPASPPQNRMASLLHRRVSLDPATMRRSLETSLRALGTDRVEYLFVHAPTEHIAKVHELAETAELLKQQGKIRAWGLGFYFKDQPVHASYLQCFDVLQFNCSPGQTTYDGICAERAGKPNILFSPFNQRRETSEPASPTAILKRLASDFPRSVILCSMFNEEHIRKNAAALADGDPKTSVAS